MSDTKATRLSKIAREFNVGISTIVDFLHKKGEKVDSNPNTKITPDQYDMLLEEFSSDLDIKKESERLNIRHFKETQKSVTLGDVEQAEEDTSSEQEELIVKQSGVSSSFESEIRAEKEKIQPKILGKIDLDKKKPSLKKEEPAGEDKPTEKKGAEKPAEEPEKEGTKKEDQESKVKVVGKIDLDSMNQRTRPDKKTKEQRRKEIRWQI